MESRKRISSLYELYVYYNTQTSGPIELELFGNILGEYNSSFLRDLGDIVFTKLGLTIAPITTILKSIDEKTEISSLFMSENENEYKKIINCHNSLESFFKDYMIDSDDNSWEVEYYTDLEKIINYLYPQTPFKIIMKFIEEISDRDYDGNISDFIEVVQDENPPEIKDEWNKFVRNGFKLVNYNKLENEEDKDYDSEEEEYNYDHLSNLAI